MEGEVEACKKVFGPAPWHRNLNLLPRHPYKNPSIQTSNHTNSRCSHRCFSDPLHPRQRRSDRAETRLGSERSQVGDAYVLGPLTGEHWLFYDALYLKAGPGQAFFFGRGIDDRAILQPNRPACCDDMR